MNWNDYEAIWKRQALPKGAAADVTLIRATFERKRRKLEATLRVRYVTDGVLGVLTALGLIGYAWWIGTAGWPIALGGILILTVSWVFVRDHRRRRRHWPGPEAALLIKLEAEISELRHQRRLLRHVGLWYFLPYLVAIALITPAVVHRLGVKHPPGLLMALLADPRSAVFIYLLVGVPTLALWWVWRDTRDAAKKRIDPRIEELEMMRRDLFGPEEKPNA